MKYIIIAAIGYILLALITFFIVEIQLHIDDETRAKCNARIDKIVEEHPDLSRSAIETIIQAKLTRMCIAWPKLWFNYIKDKLSS